MNCSEKPPEGFLEERGKRGIRAYMFHPSRISDNWTEVANTIREAGMIPIEVIDHATPHQLLWSDSPIYDPRSVGGIMVMTIIYGKSGQRYRHDIEDTLRMVRKRMHPSQELWVDGGITDATVPLYIGVDGIAAASFLVKADDARTAVTSLKVPDIVIGSDHAGMRLKEGVLHYL